MAEGQGNFGNSEQHAKAGSMSRSGSSNQSSGSAGNNTGNPQQHSEAGKKGAEAQPTEAKAKGGANSRRNS
ncbi:MAG: hypothetical protein JWM81_368 [Candidatus Saccharibacteria bacterium]|nr:hypothetical protein [Candidatus Saccharibacteria bacterium]